MIIGFDGSRSFAKYQTGTENYSHQLLLHLSMIDSKNTYIIYLRPGCRVNKQDWPDNFRFKMINFHRLWTQVGVALATFTDKLDILFTPAHTLPLVRKPGLKTVMTIHDLGAEFLPSYHQLKQRVYLNFITNYQLDSATKLIAVSKATKTDLFDRMKGKRDKVRVIYEGVAESFFQQLPKSTIRAITKSFEIESKKYFFFIGTIQPRKNLINLITAFDKFLAQVEDKQFKLVLAGSKGWLSEPVYQLPRQLGIQDQVKFLGHVSDADLPGLYQAALALTYPSLVEGFGLPILEAFASECPVITSNRSSTKEIAAGAALLVDPESIDDLVSKMIIIYKTPSVRDQLIKKGQIQLKKFSWDSCAKKTLQVLEETVKND